MMIFDDSDPIGEFDVIRRFFSRKEFTPCNRSDALSPIFLGIGDDCALLNSPPAGEVLAITSDMLVEDRHFFKDISPNLLGHKCLAVNLSDLAAMGAKPLAYTLSISLPKIDIVWLEAFSKGLHAIADHYGCALIGGDTTAGPLTIAITAIGAVKPGQVLRRDGAKIGDDIWVSNTLGDARLVLGFRRGEWHMDLPWQSLSHRMDTPTPRINLGLALRGLAHSAIDVSDGLLGDLHHILKKSEVSANIWLDEVPCSPLLDEVSEELRRLCTLQGGDDYELCFTAPPAHRESIVALSSQLGLPLTRIGEITAHQLDQPRITLLDQDHAPLPEHLAEHYMRSFDHFK